MREGIVCEVGFADIYIANELPLYPNEQIYGACAKVVALQLQLSDKSCLLRNSLQQFANLNLLSKHKYELGLIQPRTNALITTQTISNFRNLLLFAPKSNIFFVAHLSCHSIQQFTRIVYTIAIFFLFFSNNLLLFLFPKEGIDYILYLKIETIAFMFAENSFYLPKPLKIQQTRCLSSRHGLFQLFDKMESKTPFSVPQNSVVINLDNITFGPDRYTITSSQSDDHYFRIIYYCLLYYIFERPYDDESRRAYQRLLNYVLAKEIDVSHFAFEINSEEAKVYVVKFLHNLASAKNRRKLVLEEINSIPQINDIFVELIKQIIGHREIVFQQNARVIEKTIFEVLGVTLDLLSCELFLFADRYQVQVRHFQRNCQFFLLKDSHQNISKMKEQFYMGESAYFKTKEEDQLCGDLQNDLKNKGRKVKVVKKSTIKSIEWDGQEDSEAQCEDNNDFEWNNHSMLFCGKEKKNSDVGTNVESQEQHDKPKRLTFHQIMGSQDSMPTSTHRSTTLNFYSSIKQIDLRKRFHKPSCQISEFSYSVRQTKTLGLSSSVKCIKSDGFGELKLKERNSKRVPTFILNRAKAKQHKHGQNPQAKSTPKLVSSHSRNNLKVVFTYRQ